MVKTCEAHDEVIRSLTRCQGRDTALDKRLNKIERLVWVLLFLAGAAFGIDNVKPLIGALVDAGPAASAPSAVAQVEP